MSGGKKCDGSCDPHEGEVVPVMVYGSFWPICVDFNYCEEARREDVRRGFRVEVQPTPTAGKEE